MCSMKLARNCISLIRYQTSWLNLDKLMDFVQRVEENFCFEDFPSNEFYNTPYVP